MLVLLVVHHEVGLGDLRAMHVRLFQHGLVLQHVDQVVVATLDPPVKEPIFFVCVRLDKRNGVSCGLRRRFWLTRQVGQQRERRLNLQLLLELACGLQGNLSVRGSGQVFLASILLLYYRLLHVDRNVEHVLDLEVFAKKGAHVLFLLLPE